MGLLARKLSEFETTVLNNANDWAASHSAELYNQTTGPQLQQAAYYQMPIILTELSNWLVSIIQSWQSITGLVAFAFALLLLVVFGILCFVWLCKIQSTQRQMRHSMDRIELRLAYMCGQVQNAPLSEVAHT